MARTAELLAVGTELLLGNILNSDARDLSRLLAAMGINVHYHSVVGDNPGRLKAAVELAKSRADILITTGGLGPTCDDLTKQVLAEAFGKKLVFHPECADAIRAYFARSGRAMMDNNLQQAYLPEGCTILENNWGTAPGCAFQSGDNYVIMLPGPPRECVPMFREKAAPWLARLSEGVIRSRTLRVFGSGESEVETLLRDRMNALTNPTLAPYAKEGEVELRITARGADEAAARVLIAPVEEELRALLGDKIYGADIAGLEQAVLSGLVAAVVLRRMNERQNGETSGKKMNSISADKNQALQLLESSGLKGERCTMNFYEDTFTVERPGIVTEYQYEGIAWIKETSRYYMIFWNKSLAIPVEKAGFYRGKKYPRGHGIGYRGSLPRG